MNIVNMRNVLAAYGESHPPREGDALDYRTVERRGEVDATLLTLALDAAGGDDDAA